MRQLHISWTVLWAVGTAHSVLAASLSYAFTRMTGLSAWTLQPDASANLPYILLMNLVYWNGFVLFAPAVLWLARRYGIDRAGWRRALIVHLAGAAAFGCAQIFLQATVRAELQAYLGVESTLGGNLRDAFLRTFDWAVALYWGFVGLQHAVDYRSEVLAREFQTAQLETRLVGAQLTALQRQIHPHFLFNTLHAVTAMIRRHPDTAETMIERLSDLLRITLRHVGQPEVTVREELDYLRAYLDIEQLHLGERLRVYLSVSADVLDARMPNLLLQPIVENAIRHGLEPARSGGTLDVRVEREGPTLVLTVTDSGCGLSQEVSEGIGLGNTRARLQAMYGAAGWIRLSPRDGGGTVVTVHVPFGRESQPDLSVAPVSRAGAA